MLKQAGKRPAHKPRIKRDVKISACASKVFVQVYDMAMGIDARVAEDGQCTLERKPFMEVLKTYAGKDVLTIQVNNERLKIESFSMPVNESLSTAAAPEKYVSYGVISARDRGEK